MRPWTVVATLTLGVAAAAGAVEHRVPLDFATIGEALAAATAGDEVRVSNEGSPYQEQLTMPDGVRLTGGWNHPAYTFSSPARVTVIEPPADSSGSVIGLGAVGDATLIASVTIRGGDTFSGGGIFCGTGSQALISNCVIRDNRATNGGGIQVAIGSSVRIEDCHFVNNTAIARGGGINVAGGADAVEIVHCTFEACSSAVNNQPAIGGGGIATSSGIRFERNTLRDNWSGGNGGGLFVLNAAIRARHNLFYDNVAQTRDGGGIYDEGGAGFYEDTLIEGCGAGRDGGGVHFRSGTSRFSDGFVRYNVAQSSGGGVHFFEPFSGALLQGTEIVANEAVAGGGVAISGTSRASFVDIVSNTIVGNEATGTDNGGNALGGGIHVEGQVVSDPAGGILNCIIALQRAGAGIYCDGIGASPSVRYCCVYNDDLTNAAEEYAGNCTDRTGINGNIKANPRLCCSPSCDSVGPPAPDMALTASSPCLGAGQGGLDIGAHGAKVGCGVISIESESWGAVKSRYR